METLVIFSVGTQRLGLNGDLVSQILRLPPITPVPLTQEDVRGVCIVDGKVCQVICLARSMGQPEVAQTDQARLLTVAFGQELIGFPADEVLETKPVDPDKLELSAASGEMIQGLYHDENGTVELLNLEQLLAEQRVRALEPYTLSVPLPNKSKQSDEALQHQPQHVQTSFILLFRLHDELFAIETHALQELIFADRPLKPLGTADAAVLGVTELRERLVSVVDLAGLLARTDQGMVGIGVFWIVGSATQISIRKAEIGQPC